jgi:hypothetical protein
MKLIQWALDNLFTLLIIGGVLAQLFQAIRSKKNPEAAPEEAPPKEYEFEDPELAERTRQIREEIRRKIADRQRGGETGGVPGPELAPEPAAYEEPPPLIREVRLEPASPAAQAQPRLDAQRAAEILEQQAALADRLRQVEEMKASAVRRAAFEASTVAPEAGQRQQRRGALLDDLRDPAALRRAFVLREVLGPPVGLR